MFGLTRMRITVAWLVVMTGVVAASVSAVAQTQGSAAAQSTKPAEGQLADELKWLRAERVTAVTAALRNQDLTQAPATVRVITRRQIEERGYRSLHDLLRDLPGVDVLDHSQAESKGRTTFRGITGNNRFLILQDGIRINSPTGEPITPVMENFPLLAAKQVEILYGPASALYGADAFTGVINIITDAATSEGTLRVSGEGGSFSSYRTDLFGAKRFSNSVAVSFGGHWQQSDGADLSKEYPADVVMGAQSKYFGAFNSFSTHAKIGLGDNLTLGWQQSLFIAPTTEGSLPSSFVHAARPENQTLLLTTYARYRHRFSARAAGSIQVNYSRYEQLPASKFSPPTGDGYKYGLGERYQVEPQFDLVLSDKHRLTTGAVFDRIHAIPHTADLPAKYDTSKAPSKQGYTYIGTGGMVPIEVFETRYVSAGGFAQLQTDWNDRLSTTAGVRADYNEDFGSTAVNPRLGVVFQQSARTTWKVLYGRAYLAPSAFLRFENFGALTPPAAPGGLFTGGFFRVPNPELQPETLQTFELSLSHKLTDRLTVGAASYYTRVKDLTLAAPSSAPNTTFIRGASIAAPTSNQNIGEADAKGADLTVEYSVAGEQSRLDAWSSVSVVKGNLTDKVLDRVYDLPFTAETMVRAGLTYNRKDRLVVTGSVQGNGTQASFVTSSTSPVFQTRVPGYTVVNLYAEFWNRRHTLAASVRVSNLLDNHYYNAGNGTSRTYFRAPQDTRSVQAGLRLRF